MNESLHISDAGIAIEKRYNQGPNGGFARRACAFPSGKFAIGYGHVILSGGDYMRTTEIDEIAACNLLAIDNAKAENVVKGCVTIQLSQHEFDALTVLVFNIGPVDFAESALVRKLNACNKRAAADEFVTSDKYRTHYSALGFDQQQYDSRVAERAMFLGVADV
jgi:lysozyme